MVQREGERTQVLTCRYRRYCTGLCLPILWIPKGGRVIVLSWYRGCRSCHMIVLMYVVLWEGERGRLSPQGLPSLLPLGGPAVDTMCLWEGIPVVGRLKQFLHFCKEITSDRWALDVIQCGYSIEVLWVHHFAGVRSTRPPLLSADVLSSEVEGLLYKLPVIRHLSKQGIQIFVYLDDILIRSSG